MNKLFIFGIFLLFFDVPFINFIMKPMYNSIGLANNTNVIYALCAYICMTLAWFFIQGDVFKGALAGFIIFGVYVFTLLAVVPVYKLKIGLTELAWGTFLYTITTFLTNKIPF